jgi:ABC-type nitrate/sulfonate/bicarbonate transport system substrate-binding protein
MNKKSLITLLAIAGLISATAFIVSCGTAKTPLTTVTVTLDWTPNTNHTGLYVALEKGFYKEAGLNVKIIQPGAGYTDQIVATGKSEFGVSYQENVTRARSEGLPLVSIAAICQHNWSCFASLKTSGIKAPMDFEGKRYGSWDSPSEVAVLKAIMDKSGADFTKVRIVSGVTDFFSTIGRTADFEWIYAYWDGIEAGLRGMQLDQIWLKDLEPALDYYTPVLITNEELIRTNPDLVGKFVTATAKGYQYAIDNPKPAAEILLKNAPELKRNLVVTSQQWLSRTAQSDGVKWGTQKREVWQRFADWMFANKLLSKPAEVDKCFENSFLMNSVPPVDKYSQRP